MNRVYVCSPYRGAVEANVARAVALCREIAARGDGELSQLGALWFQLHPGSLNLLQAGIERNIDPDIWQDRIVPFLEFPAVFALMLPGLIVLLLATFIKPRPKGNPLNR